MGISRADLVDALEPGLYALFGGSCPSSALQAKKEGKDLYYPNKPCKNLHWAMRKLNGHCMRCIRDKKREKNT